MNRHIVATLVSMLVLSISVSAFAITAKWQFRWQADYADADPSFGDDKLYLAGVNTVNASYTYGKIYKLVGMLWQEQWSGHVDSSGLTPNLTILTNTWYRFCQYLYMKRGSRYIEVHPDGEGWDGDTDMVCTNIKTSTYLPNPYPAPVPAITTNTNLMPAMTLVLVDALNLDLPDGVDIDVNTEAGSFCNNEGGGHYHMGISDGWSDDKYNIAHELGHVVSKENVGPDFGNSYEGSEGVFHAEGVNDICDCSLTGGSPHCPTSREFTGAGQQEGFSHFIATATYNTRAEVSGAMVFYKDLREWNQWHEGLVSPYEYPEDGDEIVEHPYAVGLSTSNEVKWTEGECDPTGEDFEHYGNEWDWLVFFWNLWTVGSETFSAAQINDLWKATTDIAYLCCLAYDADPGDGEWWVPTACLPRDMSAACNTPTNPPPHQFMVGQLWEADPDFDVDEGLRNQAADWWNEPGAPSYDPARYQHFVSTGQNSRVNY